MTDSQTNGQAPKVILLVEDNPGDVRLIREGLSNTQVQNSIHVASDGMKAISFLKRRGSYANAPRPDLILLDLNLPRKGGWEVLEEIKEEPDLKRIPVVVLTASESESDILRSYQLHANCFVTKPLDLEQFLAAVKTIHNFWLVNVRLPKNHHE